MVTDAGACVAANVLVKLAPVPLTPASERAPVPIEPVVRLPPAPIETVPELARPLVTAVSTLSVPAEPTVTVPLESPPDAVTRTVPAETLRLLNELEPPSTMVPGPLVVSAKAPAMGAFTMSEYDVLLFVQVCALPRMMPAEPTLETFPPVPPVPPPNFPNVVSPETLLLTRMPVPEPMALVADPVSVTDMTFALPTWFVME